MHLLQVGLAILCKVFLIDSDVQNLGHDVVARLRLVNLPLDAALHCHGEIREYGCVHLLALLDGPAGLCHLVLYLLPADNAYIVSTYQGLRCGEGNGKVGIGIKVDRGLMVAHRNHDLVIIPLTTPRCVGYRLLPSRLGKAQASLALRSLLRQFMAFGVPSASYVPITSTACGMNHAFGLKFFISFCIYVCIYVIDLIHGSIPSPHSLFLLLPRILDSFLIAGEGSERGELCCTVVQAHLRMLCRDVMRQLDDIFKIVCLCFTIFFHIAKIQNKICSVESFAVFFHEVIYRYKKASYTLSSYNKDYFLFFAFCEIHYLCKIEAFSIEIKTSDMKILGNIVWFIFGGFGIAVEYFI